MEQINNKINELFLELFKTKSNGKYVHPFFLDLERVIKSKKKLNEFNKKKYNTEFFKDKKEKENKLSLLLKNNLVLTTKYEEQFKITEKFDISKLENILNAVENGHNLKKVIELVNKASKMRIPSNVPNNDEKNFQNYFPGHEKYVYIEDKNEINEFFEDKKLINIAIIGCGPVGMFIALYLNFLYNNYSLNNQPNVRVVIFDNRIEKFNEKEFKKPFTRERPFVTNSNFFSNVFNKIFCISEDNFNSSLFLNINVLEYMLFSKIYINNIPIILKNYDYTKQYEVLEEMGIDVMFDCTGGRLETMFCQNNVCLPNVPEWLLNETYEKLPNYFVELFKKEYNIKRKEVYDMVQSFPSENKVIFNKTEKFIKNYYYASITCYDTKSLNWLKKIDIILENESDLKLFTQLKKRYFKNEDLLLISKFIKDKKERDKVYKYYKNNEKLKDIILYIDIWHTYMRHSLEASKIIGNNKKILKINAGDTLFHSHFMIGAGLNRSINFAVKCINFLAMLDLKD